MEFYDELMKQISMIDNEKVEDEEECLISGLPLKESYVTLECNHKFNRKNIFKEIYHQKKHVNTYNSYKLEFCQLQCPYCRNIQNKLLPYDISKKKIEGVNAPLRLTMGVSKCQYIFKKGKNFGNACNKECIKIYCVKHDKPIVIQTCIAKLKTGKNKGSTCRNKPFKNSYCKRHLPKKDMNKNTN
uniref:Uncharacterized protein n=1 Tax=viral metagenome TaxID=1070528 RepID=A0A6C0KJ46_9ZZZZ